jgi:hypothetical protein
MIIFVLYLIDDEQDILNYKNIYFIINILICITVKFIYFKKILKTIFFSLY